ncbi:energy-coupling factor transport system ATP-binding protein [Hathewaya proteolytica DSM 3090]|uniref:Energy-coupling factor transporter ATP-binding protein EcfA2 n=1 Tax=Hathewaya proteolytica DSM 3090 TaxID=1121331 RepID=A0A1M6SUA0_9CLOT|nr:energy-coupling factor transporter ATPase [Hathewaya proteolytica]SHK48148.1 energy-coupling factor transport system ATP-binding protein [Hathewaya proteolytica DSM 3090]
MFIEIRNLDYVYMKDTPFEKRALDDVNFNIEKGEFTAIIGHTGSGKSTLIQLFNGLLEPTRGEVIIDGTNIYGKEINLADIRKRVGLVFQYPEYQLFEDTVEKDISFGPRNLGIEEKDIEIRVKKAMGMVGLSYDVFKDKSPFNLSGGEKRRVAIAGILAMEPEILILDEPTAGLDPAGREGILGTVSKLHKEYHMNIVLVSHSMEDVAKLAEKIVVMKDGKCIKTGTPEEVFKEVDMLEDIGLSAPAMSYLIHELNKNGFNIDSNIYTIEPLKDALLQVLNNKEAEDNA